MTRRCVAVVYQISNNDIVKLIMNSKQHTKERDWYKIIEKEFIQRGAPKNEETTSKARCVVGRIRKERPLLGGLIAIIKHEKKRQRRLKVNLKAEKSASRLDTGPPTKVEK